MKEIKSAYRFVPISKEQTSYSPEWKEKVSLDIPFSDGVSGIINYSLKAETPFYINGNDGEFCHVGNQYFIPGTSMKGCIRSVLEILSFGHLGNSRVKDNRNERFSFRDLQDRNGYMRQMSEVYCGWLTEDGKKITKYNKPYHILYRNLPSLSVIARNNWKNWTAFQKYNHIAPSSPYLYITVGRGERLPNAGKYDQRLYCEPVSNGSPATVIFSGSMINKKSDFVLIDNNNVPDLEIDKTVLNNFKTLYPEYSSIPVRPGYGRAVFFTQKDGKVETIGLSYLHKYYAKTTIREAIPKGMQGNSVDLADIMFGNISQGLKGRIQFGSAFMTEGEMLLNESSSILTVLGAPKASYYPTYLQGLNTWDNNGITISGVKRYPIKPRYDIHPLILAEKDRTAYEQKFGEVNQTLYEHNWGNRQLIPRDRDNHINMDTIKSLRPVKENSIFKGKVRFFNLKPEELGALLSALTFHGKSDKCKHSLGQAKALGYGAVSLSIEQLDINHENQSEQTEAIIQKYLQKFESVMDSFLKDSNAEEKSWKNTCQIKELLAMAKGFSEANLIDIFTPMILDEFGNTKQDYWKKISVFSPFSQILSGNIGNTPTSPITPKNVTNQSTKKEIVLATVTYWDRNSKKAKLKDSKHTQSFALECSDPKVKKLKEGDLIQVEICRNGGNIYKLKYIGKK